MKISILLPYKENFSPSYAGAVSLFINDTLKISKYKNFTTVFGNTLYKDIFKLGKVLTNHLDLHASLWLQGYLQQWPHAVPSLRGGAPGVIPPRVRRARSVLVCTSEPRWKLC